MSTQTEHAYTAGEQRQIRSTIPYTMMCETISYDDVYDDPMDDLYDEYYDGVLEDAYDLVPYKEYSEQRSYFYQAWSGAHSEIYRLLSEHGSRIYGMCSAIGTAIYKDDYDFAAVLKRV